MRVIFSRKGFDSASGKAPSPIIEGEPISLPIPTKRRSETSYRLAGVGKIVEHVTNGRIGADDLCHEDPVFFNGRWAFGQTGAAQSHLERNGVGVGDVFLFFGLFASRDGRDRHHRIFGYLQVDEVRRLGCRASKSDNPRLRGQGEECASLPPSHQARWSGFRLERSGMAQSGRADLS
jgi:Nucleotide modification associated domain 3